MTMRIMRLSMMTFCKMTLSITTNKCHPQLNGKVLLCWVSIMLNVMHAACYKIDHYTECHCAKCHFAECHGAIEIDTTMLLTMLTHVLCMYKKETAIVVLVAKHKTSIMACLDQNLGLSWTILCKSLHIHMKWPMTLSIMTLSITTNKCYPQLNSKVLLCWVSIMLNVMHSECHKLVLYT